MVSIRGTTNTTSNCLKLRRPRLNFKGSIPPKGFTSLTESENTTQDPRLQSGLQIQNLNGHLLLQGVSLGTNLAGLFLNAYYLCKSMAGILIVTTASMAFTTLMNGLSLWQTKAASRYRPPQASIDRESFLASKEQPRIALAATAVNEPGAVVSKTLRALVAVEYKNADVFLLDDSLPGSTAAKEYQEVVAELASLGIEVEHIQRKNDPAAFHGGYKAGNINHFLCSYGNDYKYYAPFDADFRPDADFLERIVPIMESPENKNISILQTGQRFEAPNTIIEQANAATNTLNYDQFARGKDTVGLSFWFGSSALIRIKDIFDAARLRGTPDQPVRMETLTEDQDTSLGLGLWKTRYLDEYLSVGLLPPTLLKYFKQHRRWTIGGTQLMFKRLLPLALEEIKEGKLGSSLSIIQDGLFRLAPFQHFFMGCGAVALWGARSAIPNYSLLMLSALFCMAANYLPSIYRGKKFGLSLKNVFLQLDLHTISAPIHVEAVAKGVTGKTMAFETTNATQKGREHLPLRWLAPNLAAFSVNVLLLFGALGAATYQVYNLVEISVSALVAATVFFLNGIRSFGHVAKINGGWRATFSDLWEGIKESFGKEAIRSKALRLKYNLGQLSVLLGRFS